MKKTLLLLVALLTSFSAFAQSAYKTLTFPDDNSENNAVSAYNKTWTATIGNDSWTIENFNNNSWKNSWTYIKCGSKNFESVANIISPAIDKAVSSVVVTIDNITASSVNSVKLVVASDANFANEVETVSAPATSLEKGDLTFTTTSTAANQYYKLVFDCAKGSKNGIVQVSKVVYYASEGGQTKQSANLKFSENKVSVKQGEEFTAPTFSKETDAAVTFTTDNEAVAKVSSEGVITLGGELGTAVITATSPETDSYYAGETTCTIEVYAYNTYKKTTTLTSGKQYLLVAQRNDSTVYAYPLDESKTYGYMSVGTIKQATDEISIKTTYDDSFTFTQQSENAYTITDCYGRQLYQSGNYNSFNVSGHEEAIYAWNVTPQTDGTFQIEMNGHIIQWGSGSYKTFACYSTVSNGAVLPYLYQLDESASGISETTVAKQQDENAPIYNLAGQRVSKDAKGVLIQNGKKFIRK